MAIHIKTPEEIGENAVAGRLTGDVLDFIEKHVRVGITTGKLDPALPRFHVQTQGTIPAPLNYAPPGYKPLPQVHLYLGQPPGCHGVPGERVLKNGDILNIDITVIKTAIMATAAGCSVSEIRA